MLQQVSFIQPSDLYFVFYLLSWQLKGWRALLVGVMSSGFVYILWQTLLKHSSFISFLIIVWGRIFLLLLLYQNCYWYCLYSICVRLINFPFKEWFFISLSLLQVCAHVPDGPQGTQEWWPWWLWWAVPPAEWCVHAEDVWVLPGVSPSTGSTGVYHAVRPGLQHLDRWVSQGLLCMGLDPIRFLLWAECVAEIYWESYLALI